MRFLVAVITVGLLEALRYVGATTCLPENRLLLLETKKQILAKLGMSEEPRNPPNHTHISEGFESERRTIEEVSALEPPSRPCAVVDSLQKKTTTISPQKVIEYRPKHLRIASGVSCYSDKSVDFVKSYRMKFKVDFNKTENELIKAELHLRKFHLHLNSTRKRSAMDRVDVNLFTPPNDDLRDGKLDYITTKFLDADSISGLDVFNITEALNQWLETFASPAKTGEIVLDVVFRCPCDMELFVPNFQFFAEKATLEITTSRSDNVRTSSWRKRQANSDSNDDEDLPFCDSKKETCCLKKFKINFERDLNWTWVVYPKELSFNYCAGLCPITGVSNFHSQFLQRLRIISKNPTAAGSPCCVPNAYRSKPVGMIINGALQHLQMPDVEAVSCACR